MAKKEIKTEKGNPSQSDKPKVAKVVALRNRFFFMLYRYSSLVFITSLISMCSSIFFLLFFIRQPVGPQYIPINEDGTYTNPTPLSVCKEDREVQKFTNEAINKVYKYDFINYADQIQSAVPYFTTDGWNQYVESFKNSGTLQSVKEYKWVVSVDQDSVPVITKMGMDNGACSWELKTPISLMFYGNNSQNQKGDLYLRVTRSSIINNPEGLGITRLVFVEKTN